MNQHPYEQLARYLEREGLKATRQREDILEVFLSAGSHVSAEELYTRVKKGHPRIGFATVYRTLKLFARAALAEERRFEDGRTRYEQRRTGSHHDHLICTRCGKILEFENPRIEELQETVARENGFSVQSHKLELYGLCANCRPRPRAAGKRKGKQAHAQS